MEVKAWRPCSSCKKPIPYSTKYFVCSVSTCNSQRTGYVFCSMNCFEVHLPAARHRDAGAVEKISPNKIVVQGSITPVSVSSPISNSKDEVLIIASRLKDYIQASADMNTSVGVMDVLSNLVRVVTDRAVVNARSEGRKTVMDRDFDFLKSDFFNRRN